MPLVSSNLLQISLGALDDQLGRGYDRPQFPEFGERIVEVLVPDNMHVESNNDRRARRASDAVDQGVPCTNKLADCCYCLFESVRRNLLGLIPRKMNILDSVPQPEFPNSNSDSLIVRVTGPRNKALAWDRALRLALSVR